MNLFKFAGPRDDRIPELVKRLETLSADIVKICGDEKTARMFVERTVCQLRCKVGPCMFCGRMTCGALMCLACQRVAIFGDDVDNAAPKESKQMAYVAQFEVKMLQRAKKHMHKCLRASKAKKIQALVRGYLTRIKVPPKPTSDDWRDWYRMKQLHHTYTTAETPAEREFLVRRYGEGMAHFGHAFEDHATWCYFMQNCSDQAAWRARFGFRNEAHLRAAESKYIDGPLT